MGDGAASKEGTGSSPEGSRSDKISGPKVGFGVSEAKLKVSDTGN